MHCTVLWRVAYDQCLWSSTDSWMPNGSTGPWIKSSASSITVRRVNVMCQSCTENGEWESPSLSRFRPLRCRQRQCAEGWCVSDLWAAAAAAAAAARPGIYGRKFPVAKIHDLYIGIGDQHLNGLIAFRRPDRLEAFVSDNLRPGGRTYERASERIQCT